MCVSDGQRTPGAQAAGEARLQENNSKLGTAVFHRERPIYLTVESLLHSILGPSDASSQQLHDIQQRRIPYHLRQVLPTEACIFLPRRALERVPKLLWSEDREHPQALRVR